MSHAVNDERRKTVRRESDRALREQLAHLKAQLAQGSGDDASHAQRQQRRRIIRHECRVGIEMLIGHAAGHSEQWSMDAIKLKGRVLDLSHDGASIFTRQRFETGQELRLTIAIGEKSHIHTNAVVRWVKDVPEKAGYASGVQFKAVAAKDQKQIDRFLQELDATVGL